MFYSHEILTSRKYGVATVWLVATLGAKSTLRKVNRKAILEVNVPKACKTIIAPEAPMALRLQSNLLYGVSRVYSQQCGYVLSDAQSAHDTMRTLFKIINTAELDPEAGRTRPDQLLLPDDPAFVPEFALLPLDFDLSNLDKPISFSPLQSSALSPYASQPSQRGLQTPAGPVHGLAIPSSDSGPSGGGRGFTVAGDQAESAQRPSDMYVQEDEGGFLPEADFTFDAEGNLLELSSEGPQGHSAARTSMRPVAVSDTALNEQVSLEHAEGQQAGRMDVDEPIFGQEYDFLPQDEPAPENMDWQTQGEQAVAHSQPIAPAEEAAGEAVATISRRQRRPRVIRLDETAELRNTNLAQWNTQYLANMQESAAHRLNHKIAIQAKKNAEFWVFGRGIGDVGSGTAHLNTNLSEMFGGDPLMQMLLGTTSTLAGQKRDRTSESDAESGSSGRRVRPRAEEEDQIGRHDGGMEPEDGYMGPMPEDDGVELGREAPSGIEDFSSAMPWNVTASVRGSSAVRNLGLPGSAGPASSLGAPGSLGGRHTSRLVSASPLVGRGRPSALEALPSVEFSDVGSARGGDLAHPGFAEAADVLDDFEFYGVAAAVDTQTAAQTQWTRDVLDREGMNFLAFIETAISEKRAALATGVEEHDLDDQEAAEVTFAGLLPPETNSRIVAAQGFLHTLTLATRNLIVVKQDKHFDDMRIRLAAS